MTKNEKFLTALRNAIVNEYPEAQFYDEIEREEMIDFTELTPDSLVSAEFRITTIPVAPFKEKYVARTRLYMGAYDVYSMIYCHEIDERLIGNILLAIKEYIKFAAPFAAAHAQFEKMRNKISIPAA